MRESARVVRQIGRTLVVTLAVCTVLAVGIGAGAATGSHASMAAENATTNGFDDIADDLDNTTDEINETADDLDETADDLNETAQELEDPVDDLNETVAILDGSIDTVGGNSTLSGEIGLVRNASPLYGTLYGTIPGTVLENGTLFGTIDGTVGMSATADVTDETETDPTVERSSDGAAGGAPADDGPGRGDAVDAGLVGALGSLVLLGGAASGAGAAGAGAGASGGSGWILRHLGRALPRTGDVVTSISWDTLPLSLLRYSRYDDSDPLEHETRREIYEAIDAEPGRYLTELEGSLDVSLSTIRHHLSVLEDEDLVVTAKQNGKRRYYPTEADDVALAAALNEPATARVLDVLAETGGASNGRIADSLDLDPSTVSHHLSTLEDDGLIERRRDGRSIVNSLAPAVEAAYASRTDSAGGPDADATERVLTYGDD